MVAIADSFYCYLIPEHNIKHIIQPGSRPQNNTDIKLDESDLLVMEQKMSAHFPENVYRSPYEWISVAAYSTTAVSVAHFACTSGNCLWQFSHFFGGFSQTRAISITHYAFP